MSCPDVGATALNVATESVVEQSVQSLLLCIQPNAPSELRRLTIASYVCDLIRRCFASQRQVDAFMFGSVPLRTYLPDGDIDISMFFPLYGPSDPLKDTWGTQLLKALERESGRRDTPFRIRNCQIIQAEFKLVKFVVADVVVDVSFNALGGLCTVAFLEWADRSIGRDHIFKRSIVLVKAWCYYESRLLGAHHGLISSYALEALVLYVFNLHGATLKTPLQVLHRFLKEFGSFDWEKYALSLLGPIHLDSFPYPTLAREAMPLGPTLLDPKELRDAVKKYSVQSDLAASVLDALLEKEDLKEADNATDLGTRSRDTNGTMQPCNLPRKLLNIMDPLLPTNNLGRSVSKASFSRIRRAFAYGAERLERLLAMTPTAASNGIVEYFENTWKSPTRMAADNQIFQNRLAMSGGAGGLALHRHYPGYNHTTLHVVGRPGSMLTNIGASNIAWSADALAATGAAVPTDRHDNDSSNGNCVRAETEDALIVPGNGEDTKQQNEEDKKLIDDHKNAETSTENPMSQQQQQEHVAQPLSTPPLSPRSLGSIPQGPIDTTRPRAFHASLPTSPVIAAVVAEGGAAAAGFVPTVLTYSHHHHHQPLHHPIAMGLGMSVATQPHMRIPSQHYPVVPPTTGTTTTTKDIFTANLEEVLANLRIAREWQPDNSTAPTPQISQHSANASNHNNSNNTTMTTSNNNTSSLRHHQQTHSIKESNGNSLGEEESQLSRDSLEAAIASLPHVRVAGGAPDSYASVTAQGLTPLTVPNSLNVSRVASAAPSATQSAANSPEMTPTHTSSARAHAWSPVGTHQPGDINKDVENGKIGTLGSKLSSSLPSARDAPVPPGVGMLSSSTSALPALSTQSWGRGHVGGITASKDVPGKNAAGNGKPNTRLGQMHNRTMAVSDKQQRLQHQRTTGENRQTQGDNRHVEEVVVTLPDADPTQWPSVNAAAPAVKSPAWPIITQNPESLNSPAISSASEVSATTNEFQVKKGVWASMGNVPASIRSGTRISGSSTPAGASPRVGSWAAAATFSPNQNNLVNTEHRNPRTNQSTPSPRGGEEKSKNRVTKQHQSTKAQQQEQQFSLSELDFPTLL